MDGWMDGWLMQSRSYAARGQQLTYLVIHLYNIFIYIVLVYYIYIIIYRYGWMG